MESEAKRFPATASHPDLGEALVPGELLVGDHGIGFVSERHSFEGGFSGTSVEWTGRDGDEITLWHPEWREWSVQVAPPGPVGVARFKNHPHIVRQLKIVQRAENERRNGRMFVRFALGFSLVIVLVYGGVSLLHGFLIDRLPVSFDQSLGKSAMKEIQEESEFVSLPEWEKRCQGYVDRLTARARGSGFEFKVLLVAESFPNAFALPGGTIMVTTGLLHTAGSSEEIAGVLAHEVGHVIRRHSMRQQAGALGIVSLVGLAAETDGGAPAALATGSALLMGMGHSREYEREADKTGLSLLVDAGIDPAGAVRFMKRMLVRDGGSAQGIFDRALGSHPATQQRIDYMEALNKKLTKGKTFKPLE